MTTVQRVVQILGWVFVLVGIVGFFYAHGMEMGMLLGIFPVNLVHNTVHLLLGIWAIVASKSFSGAKSYAMIVGILYLVLALVGLRFPDGFGLVPLGGADIWLHVVLALALLITAFVAKSESARPATA